LTLDGAFVKPLAGRARRLPSRKPSVMRGSAGASPSRGKCLHPGAEIDGFDPILGFGYIYGLGLGPLRGPCASLTNTKNARYLAMLPKQRISRTRGRIRRSHDALSPRHTVSCASCGTPKLPHAACIECGYVRPGLKVSPGRKSED